MASVLVIEDDQRIREALARGLAEAGHAVRTEATGGAALAAVVGWQPDVVVLDLGLPDLDGRDVLRMLRGVSAVPVIVATARDDEAQIIDLLDAGADDYVVKPYATAQMEARIRAVLRRGGQHDEPETEIRHGGLVLDLARRAASLDGRPLDLTRLEFDLLAYLARRSPEVVSRRELLAEVWGYQEGVNSRTVDTHVAVLRRKLGHGPEEPGYILTVAKAGYRLRD